MRDFDPTAGEFAGHDCIQRTSRHYDIASVLGSVAGPVIGGLFGNDAADAQRESGAASIAEQRRQFDLARNDQAPYRQVGSQAINRLSQMLGLGGTMGASAGGGMGGMTEAQIRAELLPQFTTANSAARFDPNSGDPGLSYLRFVDGLNNQGGETVNENALSAAIRERMNQQQPTSNPVAGAYDFTTDPSYQFRFNEGMRGVENATAGRGAFLSGAALKAIQKYGQGAASQEYGAQYNRLAGLAGTGQSSVQNTNALGQNMAGNVGNSLEGMGNVRAAASNNWGNRINDGINSYRQYNQLNSLVGKNGAGYGLPSNDTLWSQMNGF